MKLTTTSDARAWAAKRYAAQVKKWLAGELTAFPLSLPLCDLTEKEFMTNPAPVREFYQGWRDWSGAGRLTTDTWHWARAGDNTLPARLTLDGPADVALLAGSHCEWVRVQSRLLTLQGITGQLYTSFAPLYDIARTLSDADWACLCASVTYFTANPNCGLYIRQLPILGVDTKWVGQHQPELTKVLQLASVAEGDFYELTGVRKPDHLNHVVVRILCPELRKQVAGLGHLDVPVSAIANWFLRPEKILFVENLESGIALGDIPGTVAFVGRGNAATSLADIAWIANTPAFYWGDIDTYGLAIFARMCARIPDLTPILMDVKTLMAHQDLWVEEKKQHPPVIGLPTEQQSVFSLLTSAGPVNGVRLEQERISWGTAWSAIERALSPCLAELAA